MQIRIISTLFFLISLIFILGCKKENGHVFLRIIQTSDTSITSLNVSDANGNVTIDGKYHEVYTRLELIYLLKKKIEFEIKDWTPQMPESKFTYFNYSINKYFGEFEKLKKDGYFTLNISYLISKSEPIYNKPIYTQWGTFGDYYFYSYDYSDSSKLSFSAQP